MPIWFELMVMLLVTYVIGMGLGWLFWGRTPIAEIVGSSSQTEDQAEPLTETGDTQ